MLHSNEIRLAVRGLNRSSSAHLVEACTEPELQNLELLVRLARVRKQYEYDANRRDDAIEAVFESHRQMLLEA